MFKFDMNSPNFSFKNSNSAKNLALDNHVQGRNERIVFK